MATGALLRFLDHQDGLVFHLAGDRLQGRIVRYGTKSDVLTPPFDDYTDLLLASVPEMEIGWLESALERRRMESAGH